MAQQRISITIDGPILSGNAFLSRLKCGKKNCRCAIDPDGRHKAYQWSGNIDGKNTTRTLNREMYLECRRRIANYKKLKQLFVSEVNNAFKDAPWVKKQA